MKPLSLQSRRISGTESETQSTSAERRQKRWSAARSASRGARRKKLALPAHEGPLCTEGEKIWTKKSRRKILELRARVSRFALCPANLPLLQAKESLKDLGAGITLESLSLGRPTKRAKFSSYRYRSRANAPRAGEYRESRLK